MKKLLLALASVSLISAAFGSSPSPSKMMEIGKQSHATEPNLLQWYYPAIPPNIQERYSRRSPNRRVDVQQLQWETLLNWSYRHPAYHLPGYVFLGVTSWVNSAEVVKAFGAYAASSEYGLTAATARKLGADYAVYSSEWIQHPALGTALHMQAAYYATK